MALHHHLEWVVFLWLNQMSRQRWYRVCGCSSAFYLALMAKKCIFSMHACWCLPLLSLLRPDSSQSLFLFALPPHFPSRSYICRFPAGLTPIPSHADISFLPQGLPSLLLFTACLQLLLLPLTRAGAAPPFPAPCSLSALPSGPSPTTAPQGTPGCSPRASHRIWRAPSYWFHHHPWNACCQKGQAGKEKRKINK